MGVTNATGARRLYNHKPIEDNTLDHFRPWSKLFPPNWERRIYVGTTCWIACFTAIWAATYKFGIIPVACFYWGPYLWVNFGWSSTRGSSTRRQKSLILVMTNGPGCA